MTFEQRCEDGQGVILTATGGRTMPAGGNITGAEDVGGHCAGGEGTQQREVRKSDLRKPRAGQITKF